MNRLANASNRFQGKYKKVLCVCSAGLLRSPTAAVVLSQEPFNFNTRAAGLNTEYALVPVDDVLISWADEIVCMERWQQEEIQYKYLQYLHGIEDKPVINLEISDDYAYREPELIEAIKKAYTAHIGGKHDEQRTISRDDEGGFASEESGSSDEGVGTL